LVDLRNLKSDDKLTVIGLINIADTHKDFYSKKDFITAVLVDSALLRETVKIFSYLINTSELKVKIFPCESKRVKSALDA
jgi:hypothetical protein